MNKKGQVGWVITVSAIILGFIITYFTVTGIHIITTQDGTHTGYVTAIETNGIIFKTVSVYFKTDVESSQEDVYCLIDKSLIPLLQQKQQSQEKITITFYDYVLPSWAECKVMGVGIISGVKTDE